MTHLDADLLVRFGEGDQGAFDEIVGLYERRLMGYFQGLCGDRQLAEDCTQEVFCRLFRARDSYSPEASLATFVFRIARNYWIDVYRSRKVRISPQSLDASPEEDDSPTMVAEVAGEGASPDQAASLSEEQERLQEALRKLPEIQSSVLALAGGQGMRYEEVAETLGIPIGTVKSRVHAAVQNLRRLMGVEEAR